MHSNGPNLYLSWSKQYRKIKNDLSGLLCIKTRRCAFLSSLCSVASGVQRRCHWRPHNWMADVCLPSKTMPPAICRCGHVLGRHSSKVFLSLRTLHPEGPKSHAACLSTDTRAMKRSQQSWKMQPSEPCLIERKVLERVGGGDGEPRS